MPGKKKTADIEGNIKALVAELPQTKQTALAMVCELAWHQAREQSTAAGRNRANSDVEYAKSLLKPEGN